ncbi:MAG: transglycosylase domain-containing protein [Erysipelotrichaceae bacterium]|nr:transglycosylase domain-containing protein [Erysipelotrichaceae bacterium]
MENKKENGTTPENLKNKKESNVFDEAAGFSGLSNEEVQKSGNFFDNLKEFVSVKKEELETTIAQQSKARKEKSEKARKEKAAFKDIPEDNETIIADGFEMEKTEAAAIIAGAKDELAEKHQEISDKLEAEKAEVAAIINEKKEELAENVQEIKDNIEAEKAEAAIGLSEAKVQLDEKHQEIADKFEEDKADATALLSEKKEELNEKAEEIKDNIEAEKAEAAIGFAEAKVQLDKKHQAVSETVHEDKAKIDKVFKEKIKKLTIKKDKVKSEKVRSERPKAKTFTFIMAILMCLFLLACLGAVIGAFLFAAKLCEDKPTLVVEDLVAPDSSTIYDSEGNKIMELGMYLRENISYEEMPNTLIDAFLAIEDSRFFEHFGFDIPRFTKAALENVRTRDFSQGGSTITMQLIKNTYFSIDADADSTIAAREGMSGIKRKMQEIVLALELENRTEITKQEIIAMYINKVNYGNNIRGVQKAAQYYFGKDAKNLTLTESAFLAGLINSPNSYNPYNDKFKYDNGYLDPEIEYLENGTERRNEVLNLMVDHGYISEAEAKLAKSVRLEDLLVGIDVSFTELNEKYQSYIDAVIDEVEETTGESPYRVGMEIYTNMNPYMQEYVYDMQNEEEYVGIEFPNELCQSAIVVMDNQNGAIEALGGGRGENEEARQFNRATSAYLNPGSSIKPVIDYALCIDVLGYATSHTFTDQPYYLYDGNVLISNYDHAYHGDMLMTEALGRSQNTPAVQALAAVVEEKSEDFVVDYMNSIGFKFDYSDFDLQFAIGGNRCLVTPLQLAGAHAMFMNGGKYIRPHCVNYIVYNGKNRENFVADTVGKQIISDATAWMVAYLEEYNMTGNFSSLMWYCKRYIDYPLYGKTGTTDWGDSGLEYGIPEGATKDSWLVMQTNKYTISCWTGYDKLEKGAYFTTAEYQDNTKSKIVTKLLQELETHHSGTYDPYTPLAMPDSVTEITHVKGAYPYAEPSGGYPTVKGYIAKKALADHPLGTVNEAMDYAKEHKKYIDGGIANLNGAYDGGTVWVTFGTGAGESGFCTGDACDLSSSNVYGETTYAAGPIWFPHWTAIYSGGALPPYFYTITSDTGESIVNATEETSFSEEIGGSRVTVCVSTSSSSSQSCIALSAG